jgi:hypothetical protein
LGLQVYDPNFPPPDPIILKEGLHVKLCPVCDKFGHKAVNCPELCHLFLKAGDCNHIRAVTQWKNHPDYIIAQEDLHDFDVLASIDHSHFSLIFLSSFT